MEELVRKLSVMIAGGDVLGAERFVAALESAAEREVGTAILAMAMGDSDMVLAHARRAHELAPDAPQPLSYVASGLVMKGNLDEAQVAAEQAVKLGGGVRAKVSVANIYTARGDHPHAIRLLTEVVAGSPTSIEALNALGAAHYRAHDWSAATSAFARAFDLNPNDRTALDSMIEMQAEIGKFLGAMAALQITRTFEKEVEGDDKEKKLALIDLAAVLVTRTAQQQFPSIIDEEVDEAVMYAMGSCKPRPNRVRLTVVRALVDCERYDKAKRMLEVIEKEPLDDADRSVLLYLQGVILGKEGKADAALAKWRASFAADGLRTEAATNLVSALLEVASEQAFAEIGKILDGVPEDLKGTSPHLVYNEGVYLKQIGKRTEAERAFERVLRITRGQGEIGMIAVQALAMLRAS